jgi:hypothetical protein
LAGYRDDCPGAVILRLGGWLRAKRKPAGPWLSAHPLSHGVERTKRQPLRPPMFLLYDNVRCRHSPGFAGVGVHDRAGSNSEGQGRGGFSPLSQDRMMAPPSRILQHLAVRDLDQTICWVRPALAAPLYVRASRTKSVPCCTSLPRAVQRAACLPTASRASHAVLISGSVPCTRP